MSQREPSLLARAPSLLGMSLGNRCALSPGAWLLIVPFYAAGVLLLTPPPGVTPIERLAGLPLSFIALGVRGSILTSAYVIVGKKLRGRLRDALLVAAIWLVAIVTGYQVSMLLGASLVPDPAARLAAGWGWYLSTLLQQLCLAALYSIWMQKRKQFKRSIATAVSVSQKSIENSWWRASLRESTKRQVNEVLIPQLKCLIRGVPKKSQSSETWLRWADELLTFATGPVRQVAASTPRLGEIPLHSSSDFSAADEIKVQMPTVREELTDIIKRFHLVRPISMLAYIIFLPLAIRPALDAGPEWWRNIVFVSITVVMFQSMAVFTQSVWYRTRRRRVQWTLWLVGLIGFGISTWPLCVALQAINPDPFPKTLSPLIPALWFTICLTIFTFVVGALSVRTSSNEIGTAAEEVDISLCMQRNLAMENQNQRLRQETISRIHGIIQGRLVALALIAEDAAGGNRCLQTTSNQLASEIRILIEHELPELAELDAGDDCRVELIGASFGDMLHSWGRLVEIDLSYSPELASQDVDRSVAESLVRVIAEALGNAVKHGAASTIHIVVLPSADALLVKVSDNGIGLKRGRVVNPDTANLGIGLSLIDELTEGNWNLISRVDGCTLSAHVPPKKSEQISLVDDLLIVHDLR